MRVLALRKRLKTRRMKGEKMEKTRKGFKRLLQKLLMVAVLAMTFVIVPVQCEAATPKLSHKNIKLAVREKKTIKVIGSVKSVKWSSSVKKVAVVKNGRITAKQPGLTVITAKVGKKKLTCKVKVVQKYSLSEMCKKVNTYLKKRYRVQKWVCFESEASIWNGKYAFTIRSQSGNVANVMVGMLFVDPSTGKGVFEDTWGMEKKIWNLY